MTARRFELHRDTDATGVSGTGVVAEGIEFSGGCVALRWLSDWPTSVVFHDKGIEAVQAVHGHGGKTRIVWVEADRGGWDAAEKANAHADKQSRLTEELQAEIERLRAQQLLSAPDALLTGFNTAALFGPYLNADGSVTMRPQEVERVTTKVTNALRAASSKTDLPWRVHYAGRGDEVVGAFADRLAAEAFVQLTRKRDELAVSGPEGHPPTRNAFQPKAPPETVPFPSAGTVDELIAQSEGELAPAAVSKLGTCFVQRRGMQYVVVDTSVEPDSRGWCRCSFRTRPDAQSWIAQATASNRAYRILTVQEVLDILDGLLGAPDKT